MNTFGTLMTLLAFGALGVLAYLLTKTQRLQNEYHVQLKNSLDIALGALEQRYNGLLQQLFHQQQESLHAGLDKVVEKLHETTTRNTESQHKAFAQFTTDTHNRQVQNIRLIQNTLKESLLSLDQQLKDALGRSTEQLSKRVVELGDLTEKHLTNITGRVEQRLNEGFEKTTATFTQVVERLALIDEAQKKITQLSTNVVSLQEILADKRSRGAFGEVQLAALIRNVMPENAFALQHTLKNSTRVDCMLFLPEPTGNVAVDAKFPLESFKNSQNTDLDPQTRTQASLQFKKDVQKHIQDIASKYIAPPETADGAIMFIPAEAIFAEIHAHHPDIVEQAHRAKVWIASPTTMMAILTTARAVLKDAATRKQIHIIQEHLGYLAKDFTRFEKRMEALSRHIEKAHTDAEQVHTSARKIASRFNKIEQVEIEPDKKIKEIDNG